MTDEAYKNISYEKWVTPVSQPRDLWLDGVLQTGTQVHFVFLLGQQKDEHVLTIDNGSPYRLVEEDYIYATLSNYFKFGTRKDERPNKTPWHSWKFWRTPFVEEISRGYADSPPENLFEYCIRTQDEMIEIVAPDAQIKWDFFPNLEVKDVFAHYLDKGKRT